MLHTVTHNIGTITDSRKNPLLRMWTVEISFGNRPLSRHQHLNFELMMVNAGNGVYCTEEARYPIQAGDVFVFSSNEWHCITETGPDGLCITNLQFDPMYIGNSLPQSADSLSQVNPSFCFHHSRNFRHRIEACRAGILTALLTEIKKELICQGPEYALAAESCLNLFLVTLIRDFNYADDTDTRSRKHLRNLPLVFSYIDGHLSDKLSLQELSDLAGLTPTYFSGVFKELVGLPLWDYISSRRIDRAISLITAEDSRKNMLEIAAECGFNNTANFNKTFKKITGMTPREYRNGGFTEIS